MDAPPPAKRTRIVISLDSDDECGTCQGDGDVVEVAPAPVRADFASASVEDTVTGDELVITAVKGPVACSDYPHSRATCITSPTMHDAIGLEQATQHCKNCFCFVCDTPVAECVAWSGAHCFAIDGDVEWKRLRVFHAAVRTGKYSNLINRRFVDLRGVTSLGRLMLVGNPPQTEELHVRSLIASAQCGDIEPLSHAVPDFDNLDIPGLAIFMVGAICLLGHDPGAIFAALTDPTLSVSIERPVFAVFGQWLNFYPNFDRIAHRKSRLSMINGWEHRLCACSVVQSSAPSSSSHTASTSSSSSSSSSSEAMNPLFTPEWAESVTARETGDGFGEGLAKLFPLDSLRASVPPCFRLTVHLPMQVIKSPSPLFVLMDLVSDSKTTRAWFLVNRMNIMTHNRVGGENVLKPLNDSQSGAGGACFKRDSTVSSYRGVAVQGHPVHSLLFEFAPSKPMSRAAISKVHLVCTSGFPWSLEQEGDGVPVVPKTSPCAAVGRGTVRHDARLQMTWVAIRGPLRSRSSHWHADYTNDCR